ncbi:MAG TPA: zinc-dependent metalloprotease [Solirubrobacteraceae bacterium]|nr:zinc-dependent metalloprotease [Solirubrobacteraceae bacterium]
MVDWRLAGKVAEGVAALQPAGDPKPFEALAGPAEESERLVLAYTGLQPLAPLPPPEAVDRPTWIRANLGSLKGVLDPAAEKVTSRMGTLAGPVGAAAGAVLGMEAGAVSGFLAGRVLGQYEFPVLDPEAPARLLFVAPNLGHAAQSLEAAPDELLRWVALHETTHALQFGGVPWLRAHLAGLVRELTAALDVDPGRLFGSLGGLADLRGLVDAVREGGVAALVVGPERRGILDRVQAFMAVLEGYAEHVMDAVGAELIPDLPRLRTALERRRHDRTGLLRLLERLIGMDMKLRQYEQGKRFCDEVVERGGIAALNRVWELPSRMPTVGELTDPGAWLARTAPAAA